MLDLDEKYSREVILTEYEEFMYIDTLEYKQFESTPMEWHLEKCSFGRINLVVGKNATGKSRMLSVINGLSKLLVGGRKIYLLSGNYDIQFSNEESFKYLLHYENRKIIHEEIRIDSNIKLQRGSDGSGKLFYVKEDAEMEFQTPEDEIASVARRDNIQHPFLEDLYHWGDSTHYYQFGTTLGREQLAIIIKDENKAKEQLVNTKDPNFVVAIFKKGQVEFGDRYTQAIIDDMNSIGYSINEIGLNPPETVIFKVYGPSEPVDIFVKESDLACNTHQVDMSQGMFRSLSLLIQIHYSLMSATPSCLVIDDIGEGLDFDRSSLLVKLLINRAQNSSIQLVMSTNDRFIMNNVPLDYWMVMQRIGNKCKVYNIQNSPQLFSDFKLMGLNNFDFFSSEYYLK